jgi:hypothetical protein
VTEDNALHIKQESAWRLLVELFPSGGPGSEHQAVKRVTEAVQELGLQPAQVERIREALLEALREAKKRGNQGQHDLPVIVRTWISGAHPEDPSPSNSGAQQGDRRKCRGWGFFLIQKQGDPQVPAAEAHHVIELYLYQERELSRKDG